VRGEGIRLIEVESVNKGDGVSVGGKDPLRCVGASRAEEHGPRGEKWETRYWDLRAS
jgi:hypothetical protein